MATTRYDRSVFINCPYDEAYRPIFEALTFTIQYCGFTPRCALEISDSGGTRIQKIEEIIEDSRFSVHDICRVELDAEHNLPRFNMPLELGLCLGARRFGTRKQQKKQALILDTDSRRYQKFCSDIAGQDIKAHGGRADRAITALRDWIRALPVAPPGKIPGSAKLRADYTRFRGDLPLLLSTEQLTPADLHRSFPDLTSVIELWIERRNQPSP